MEVQNGRSPHGERGLKCHRTLSSGSSKASLPPRGAWIEIARSLSKAIIHLGRSPHGERGLK